ncbi:subtilisin-like protease SBT5.4 [Daucus carota subsp. sativus]|uniref:subtilisin-like protease SBT5.4 n=1 Tax=Daucus carota subsp. sativus TaxID=79200 RepID=UPI003083348F
MASFKFHASTALSYVLCLCLLCSPALAIKRAYVVYLGEHSHQDSDLYSAELKQRVADSHHQFLASSLGSKQRAREAIYNSYHNHINGFAAVLEEEDAAKIARHPDVLSVFLDQGRKKHTTNSWEFLNMNAEGFIRRDSLWKQANFGEDIIIANLDTGVWPDSKSFSDEGYGPIPAKWRGTCDKTKISCNKKLIGARYFSKGYEEISGKLNASVKTPVDHEGHGTHTLSTLGGNFVHGAKVFGFNAGTAKGGSPRARVASYKVCWPPVGKNGECFDSDILEAFDWAIHDQVDVLSLSIGGMPTAYFNDAAAIGAFHAVKKGIVVICSAGNEGPGEGTVTNVAPWIITVGASTISREFLSYVKLRNGKLLKGASLSGPLSMMKFYPLINAADAKAVNASVDKALLCEAETLDPNKVKGKIVVCLRGENDRVAKSLNAYHAGAVGMILCNNEENANDISADAHIIAASHLTYDDGQILYAYLNSTKYPAGYITPPSSHLGQLRAPSMAVFSSRGPNTVTPDILKPDITAPGVDIIAAFSEEVYPDGHETDHRVTPFNIESGTSMACPHVSGVVGLLKKIHPGWSAAAIKSAIITTATTRDNFRRLILSGPRKEATPFDYGGGHIQPNLAMDPGLVYDLNVDDYLNFLCGMGYNSTVMKTFSDGSYNCHHKYNLLNFNYPSITVGKLSADGTTTVLRTLKNVGTPGTYRARVLQPQGVSVSVLPSTLTFDKIGQEKSFELILEPKITKESNNSVFGELLWSDGKHNVRSPIVVSSIVA